jgi:hypothetical protein
MPKTFQRSRCDYRNLTYYFTNDEVPYKNCVRCAVIPLLVPNVLVGTLLKGNSLCVVLATLGNKGIHC